MPEKNNTTKKRELSIQVSELAKIIADKMNLDFEAEGIKKQKTQEYLSKVFIDAFVSTVTDLVEAGKRVTIAKFGRFQKKQKKQKKVVSGFLDKEYIVPEKEVLTFSPAFQYK